MADNAPAPRALLAVGDVVRLVSTSFFGLVLDPDDGTRYATIAVARDDGTVGVCATHTLALERVDSVFALPHAALVALHKYSEQLSRRVGP